jgi:hypothetical protein
MIAPDVVLGRDVRILQPDLVNLYGCTIGDGSKVGAFVEIQRGAAIGKHCKVVIATPVHTHFQLAMQALQARKHVIMDYVLGTRPVAVSATGLSHGLTVTPDAESLHRVMVGYRMGDMWAPNLDRTEGLNVEFQHFVSCLETGAAPRTDAQTGLQVVRFLEAATQSMKERGRLVELNLKGAAA